jgi:hypothetical protein
MGLKENIINKFLAIRWTARGGRLWRITPGKLWAGEVVGNNKNIIALKNSRPIEMFKKGTPDNLGYEMVVITPDMVGKKLPVFCLVESKTKAYKKITTKQKKKLDFYSSVGVKCYIARENNDPDGVYDLIEWVESETK